MFTHSIVSPSVAHILALQLLPDDHTLSCLILNCRVEPKGASHVFIVHGMECRKSAEHPTCTYDPTQAVARKGMMYVINIQFVMGYDWKVGLPASPGGCICTKAWKDIRLRQLALICFTSCVTLQI